MACCAYTKPPLAQLSLSKAKHLLWSFQVYKVSCQASHRLPACTVQVKQSQNELSEGTHNVWHLLPVHPSYVFRLSLITQNITSISRRMSSRGICKISGSSALRIALRRMSVSSRLAEELSINKNSTKSSSRYSSSGSQHTKQRPLQVNNLQQLKASTSVSLHTSWLHCLACIMPLHQSRSARGRRSKSSMLAILTSRSVLPGCAMHAILLQVHPLIKSLIPSRFNRGWHDLHHLLVVP